MTRHGPIGFRECPWLYSPRFESEALAPILPLVHCEDSTRVYSETGAVAPERMGHRRAALGLGRCAALVALVVVSLAGCGGPAVQRDRGRDDTGGPLVAGTLDPDALPARPVVAGPEGLSAFGLTEVPAGSRLQAAYVLADALARAELSRLVQIRVESLLAVEVSEQDQVTRQSIRQRCVESANAMVPGLGASAHGAKASPDGRSLRVAARIDLPAESVRALLQPAYADAPPEALEAAVRALLAPGDAE